MMRVKIFRAWLGSTFLVLDGVHLEWQTLQTPKRRQIRTRSVTWRTVRRPATSRRGRRRPTRAQPPSRLRLPPAEWPRRAALVFGYVTWFRLSGVSSTSCCWTTRSGIGGRARPVGPALAGAPAWRRRGSAGLLLVLWIARVAIGPWSTTCARRASESRCCRGGGRGVLLALWRGCAAAPGGGRGRARGDRRGGGGLHREHLEPAVAVAFTKFAWRSRSSPAPTSVAARPDRDGNGRLAGGAGHSSALFAWPR